VLKKGNQNTMKTTIATITHTIDPIDAYWVTVQTQMIEGHYQTISHAPFSRQPRFDTEEQALAFIARFGVESSAIVRS
jgi:hypothetical protein